LDLVFIFDKNLTKEYLLNVLDNLYYKYTRYRCETVLAVKSAT